MLIGLTIGSDLLVPFDSVLEMILCALEYFILGDIWTYNVHIFIVDKLLE